MPENHFHKPLWNITYPYLHHTYSTDSKHTDFRKMTQTLRQNLSVLEADVVCWLWKSTLQLDWCDINGAIVAKRAYSIKHGYNKHGSIKPWKDCWAFLKKRFLKVMENEKMFYPPKIFDIYLVKAPSPSTSKNVLLHELGNLVRRQSLAKSTAWQRSLEDHLVWSLTLCETIFT